MRAEQSFDSNSSTRSWCLPRIQIFAGIGLLITICVALWVSELFNSDQAVRLVERGHSAYELGDFRRAFNLARQALADQPDNVEATMLAGHSAVRLEGFAQAVSHFDRVSNTNETYAVAARNAAGDVLLLKLHRLSEAEKRYQESLDLDPENTFANDRMGFLMGVTSRSHEQIPFRLNSIRQGDINPLFLLSYIAVSFSSPTVLTWPLTVLFHGPDALGSQRWQRHQLDFV